MVIQNKLLQILVFIPKNDILQAITNLLPKQKDYFKPIKYRDVSSISNVGKLLN